VELVDVKDASALESVKIGWIEDLDQGFSTAKKEGKPSVLLLYADWCSWCKKLLTEVIPTRGSRPSAIGLSGSRRTPTNKRIFRRNMNRTGSL